MEAQFASERSTKYLSVLMKTFPEKTLRFALADGEHQQQDFKFGTNAFKLQATPQVTVHNKLLAKVTLQGIKKSLLAEKTKKQTTRYTLLSLDKGPSFFIPKPTSLFCSE